MREPEVVDPATENPALDALRSGERVGLDTEFMRERTYFAELCLIQIATPKHIYCADPMSGGDLTEFWEILTGCPWVVHSGRQDIEVLYQAGSRMPPALFDTQIAAAILGHAPQLGYAGLVADLFGVELAKSHTRADWSRRPLPSELLDYAAEDVAYLLPAYDMLNERLERLGRRGWVEQDSLELLNASLYEVDPRQAVDRVKGARNLRGSARAAATGLAAWREREALHRNRPRQWIMRDAVLLEIAQTRPATRRALEAISELPGRTARRAGDELLDIVRAAEQDSADYRPPPRPDERQKQQLKKMQSRISSRAAELGISGEILAPRRELSLALFGERDSRVFRGWRRDVIGTELLQLLQAT